MKIRRAATLTLTFEEEQIVVYNFVSKDRFTCSHECLQFLASMDNWQTEVSIFQHFRGSERSSLALELEKLVKLNALVVQGTPQAKLDETYRRQWLWGSSAGLFHFSIRNTRFITGQRTLEFMRMRRAWRKSPPVTQSNRGMKRIISLPYTDLETEPFSLMRKRRSRRKFMRSSISLQVLADCLFAGNGIVEFIEDKDFGRLPRAMTPSGGARNPFELYVYAARVDGLKIGFYHYDAIQGNLGLVRAGKVNVPKMLGTQKWPQGAAAIILMVAHFPRTMWKYHMPMAYRVVAMEAGFIGQNIALAATHHGLSAVPSGALNDSLIEGYLGIPAVESAVLLTMSIGRPKAQAS